MTRSDWLELMRPLRDKGLTHQQIADELGCKVSTVRNYLTDPDGSKVRERKRRRRQGKCPPGRFPAERVNTLLREWIVKESHQPRRTFCRKGQGAIAELERQSGVNARQIYAILNGEREFVTLSVVDRLVCGMGRPDLFHSEFEDLYA